MAAGERLRGNRLARRQPLLRRHLRLLPDPARPRLLAVREVRPRLHRPRGAREDAASRAGARSRWHGTARTSPRAMATLFAKGDPAKYIDLPLSNYSTWPNDKLLLDGEMVGVSTFSGYSYNERSMLSLGAVDVDVPIGTEVDARLGRGGRRLAQAGRRAPRPDRDPRDREPGARSPRCRARPTPRAGGRRRRRRLSGGARAPRTRARTGRAHVYAHVSGARALRVARRWHAEPRAGSRSRSRGAASPAVMRDRHDAAVGVGVRRDPLGAHALRRRRRSRSAAWSSAASR